MRDSWPVVKAAFIGHAYSPPVLNGWQGDCSHKVRGLNVIVKDSVSGLYLGKSLWPKWRQVDLRFNPG